MRPRTFLLTGATFPCVFTAAGGRRSSPACNAPLPRTWRGRDGAEHGRRRALATAPSPSAVIAEKVAGRGTVYRILSHT